MPIFVLTFLNLSKTTALERIQKRGKLVVVTRNSPTTYYEDSSGKTGFEYDLVKLFADRIGVKLKIIVPDSFGDILPIVAGKSADLAAAGIAITEKRKSLVAFSPSYMEVKQQLIYQKKHNKRPKSTLDLVGKTLEVIVGSSHEERLIHIKNEEIPELTWTSNKEISVSELIEKVNNGEIDFAIADSNHIKVSQRYMPEIRVAFNLGEPEKIAWALPKSNDRSVHTAIKTFFAEVTENGELTQLIERHFGHIKRFNYVDKRTLLRQIENRLPLYETSFKQAGKATGIDWRLLAALGYQESHWKANAISPTGVRGLMMLTQRTAAQMGVKSRLDPRQSIFGGAKYLKQQLDKLPERIAEPDRTWLALAAYNIGFGHLEDARILAQQQNKDPDKWVVIKETLPLLSKKKYYTKTRFGYARGTEPVNYVQNIRDYYEVLIWYSKRDKLKNNKPNKQIQPNINPSTL